ncbi:SBDS-domain-containing protein [Auriculariales sp. MPI-PUGE-AT-0066]|nr:SBDS-domain-containing protein [Auriculariales sp. MPI-PUGE-AT-0066]
MSLINQPSNQIKLTNVSIVRLKKGGKRFEIACYKNKVQEWRNGVETDIDDVLQIANVFVNVGKGEVARSDDLLKAFGTSDVQSITKEILKKGELQVGEKERAHELGNLWKEIATLVAEKCVDPATGRNYSVGIIEKAMHEAGFSVKQGKNAKSQASPAPLFVTDCIKLIQTESKLPIQRARMRIRVVLSQPVTAAPTPPVVPAQRASPKLDAADAMHAGAAVMAESDDDGEPAKAAAGDDDEEGELPVRAKRGKAKAAARFSDDEDDGPRGKGGKAKGKAKARQRDLELAAASLKLEDDSDEDGPARPPRGKKAKAKAAAAKQLAATAATDDSDRSSYFAAPGPKKKSQLVQHVQATLTEAELRKQILQCADVVERHAPDDAEDWDAVLLIDPGQLKVINDLLQRESRGRGRTETIAVSASA